MSDEHPKIDQSDEEKPLLPLRSFTEEFSNTPEASPCNFYRIRGMGIFAVGVSSSILGMALLFPNINAPAGAALFILGVLIAIIGAIVSDCEKTQAPSPVTSLSSITLV